MSMPPMLRLWGWGGRSVRRASTVGPAAAVFDVLEVPAVLLLCELPPLSRITATTTAARSTTSSSAPPTRELGSVEGDRDPGASASAGAAARSARLGEAPGAARPAGISGSGALASGASSVASAAAQACAAGELLR